MVLVDCTVFKHLAVLEGILSLIVCTCSCASYNVVEGTASLKIAVIPSVVECTASLKIAVLPIV